MRLTAQFLALGGRRCAVSQGRRAGDCLSGPVECGQIEPAECARRREGGQGFSNAGPHARHQFFSGFGSNVAGSAWSLRICPATATPRFPSPSRRVGPPSSSPILPAATRWPCASASWTRMCLRKRATGSCSTGCARRGAQFLVVATKVDKLSGNERTRNLAALKKGHELDEILPVSAKTGYGVKELWARIEEAGGEGHSDHGIGTWNRDRE